jgi:AraC-like DNA-binding protein
MGRPVNCIMTAPITQQEALRATDLAEGDQARFFASPLFPGLDCLTASFRRHAYPLHTHDTYTIGNVEAGIETWMCRGARHYAGPGWFALTNPLDVHDGAPHGEGYAYRMSYPSVDLIQEIAAGLCGHRFTGLPVFKEPAVHDPQCARLFADAHRLLESDADALAGEERLHRAYAYLLARHAGVEPASLGREPGPVARVRAAIEERFAESLRLTDLAAIARLSLHHLIRVFRAEVGLTPHAYLIDVRVRRARSLLKRGTSPADTALSVGFADQAHLTRAFKARLGVSPGAYRRAHLDG